MKGSLVTSFLALGAIVESKPLQNIETRTEMTYVQNWCVAGGAVLGGLGALTAGIASLISASDKAKDCSTQDKEIHNRELQQGAGSEKAMHETLTLEGFNTTGSMLMLDDATGDLTFPSEIFQYGLQSAGRSTNARERITDSILHTDGGRFDNLTFAMDGSVSSLVAHPDFDEGDTDLNKRTNWKTSQIYISYHPTNKCFTTKGKSAIKKDVKKALNMHSNNRHQASCFALYAGGKWTGHLKVMDVSTAGHPSEAGLERACYESHKVTRTCG